MKTLEVKDRAYCNKCPYRTYNVREEKVYADNDGQIISLYVTCDHAEICEMLWNHLCDYYEENGNDEDYEDYNEEYSFTTDATYEDRQI